MKPLQNMNEDALKMYFDTEINQILDKIKGIKTEEPDEKYRNTLNTDKDETIEVNDIDQMKDNITSEHASGNF